MKKIINKMTLFGIASLVASTGIIFTVSCTNSSDNDVEIKKLYNLFQDSVTKNPNIDPNQINAENLNSIYDIPNNLPKEITWDISNFNVSKDLTTLSFDIKLKYNDNLLGSKKTIKVSGFVTKNGSELSDEQIIKLYNLFQDSVTKNPNIDPQTITSDNLSLVFETPKFPSNIKNIEVIYSDFQVYNQVLLNFGVQLKHNGKNIGSLKKISISGFKDSSTIIPTPDVLASNLVQLINKQFTQKLIFINRVSNQSVPQEMNLETLINLLQSKGEQLGKKLANVIVENQNNFNFKISNTAINHKQGTFGFKLEIKYSGTNIIKWTNLITLTGYNAPQNPTQNVEDIINTINNINSTISMIKTDKTQIDLPANSVFNNEIARFFSNLVDQNGEKLYTIFSDLTNQAFYNFELIFIEQNYDLGKAIVIFKIMDNNRHTTKYSKTITLNNFTLVSNQKASLLKAKDVKKWIDDLVKDNTKTKYFELVKGAAWIYPDKIKSFYELSFYLQKEFIFILNNYFNISFNAMPKLNNANGSFSVSLKITNQYDNSDSAISVPITFSGMKKPLDNHLNTAQKIVNAINSLSPEAFIVNANGKQRPNDIFWVFSDLNEYITNELSSFIPDNYVIDFDTSQDNSITTKIDGEIRAHLKIMNSYDPSDVAITKKIRIYGFEKYRSDRISRLSPGMKEMRKIVGNAGERYKLVGAENILNTTIFSYADLEKYLSDGFKKILVDNYNEYGENISTPLQTKVDIIGGIDYSNDDAISLYLRITNKKNERDAFVTNKLTFTGFKHYKQVITISKSSLSIDAQTTINKVIPNLSHLNAYSLKNLLLQDENTLIDKLWAFIDKININPNSNLFKLTKNDVILNFNTISTPASPNQSILAFSFSLSISGQQRFFINKENMITMFIINLNKAAFENLSIYDVEKLIKQRINSSEILVLTANENLNYDPNISFKQLVNRFQNTEKNIFNSVLNSHFNIELLNKKFDKNLGILNADLKLSKNNQSIILYDFNFRGFKATKETLIFYNRHDDSNNKDIVVLLDKNIDKESQLSAKEFYDIFNMPHDPNPDENPYDIEYLNKWISREFLLKFIKKTLKNNPNNKVKLEADDIEITKLLLKENVNSLGFWFKLSSKGQEKFNSTTIDGQRLDEEFKYSPEGIIIKPLGNYIEIQGFSKYTEQESLSKTEANKLVIDYNGKIPASALTSYKHIEPFAFAANNNLYSIVIPDNILNIGKAAFAECNNLVETHLPNSLFMIPDWLFWKAESLNKVNIPNQIVLIGEYSFGGEYNQTLQKVVGPNLTMDLIIPDSVKFIKAWAFSFSTINSFVGGKDLLYIGWGSFVASINTRNKIINFSNSQNLKKIDNNAFQDNQLVSKLVLPKSVDFIGAYAFSNNRIKEIIIPEKVTKIRAGAFAFCVDLANVEIGNSVVEIGGSAFEKCESLTEIVIPHSVELISSYAFKNSGLRRVDLGKVALIGPSAFEGVKLEELIIPSSVKLIDRRAFANNGRSIKKLVFESVISPNNNQDKSGDRYFANQVENIAEYAFSNSLDIKELNIPASVKKIGVGAFSGNFSITKIRFVESVGIAFQGFSIIKQQAFGNLENLVSIEIPNIYQNRNINIGLTKEQENMIRWY